MTRHVFQAPISSQPLRRIRSRSFGDIADSRPYRSSFKVTPDMAQLNIPALNDSRIPSSDLRGNTRGLTIHEAPLSSDIDKGGKLDRAENGAGQSLANQNVPQEAPSLPFLINVLYGMINATIVIPVIMSFGNIIYQNAAFQPYMPVLVKLTMVSGVVHQLAFSSLSSLPFAVGSVQDAGLIFLSSMASNMVSYCNERGYPDDVLLATVTVGLAVATVILGVGLIIIGRLQLAGYVRRLPTCVVAGYLAYIGWFCGKSGIGIMAGTSGNLTVHDLIKNWDLILPGLFGGFFIYFCVRTFKHVAALPTCIVLLLIAFYLVLLGTGRSVEQATSEGWIRQSEPAPVWYHTWDYLHLDKVVWSALPQLLLTELGMIFVVALSSSLDVAAIELERKTPLNYNGELQMVGLSNMISGLTGGYTGSYIFSQTIFSLRAGVQSRVAGFALALCQTVIIVTPFPILSLVPNFFYGSLLGMICLDLVYEWLWEFRTKVTIAEYITGLSTFFLIQIIGVEYGIIAGVAIYVLGRQTNIDMGQPKVFIDDDIDDQQPPRDTSGESTPLLSHDQNGVNGSKYFA